MNNKKLYKAIEFQGAGGTWYLVCPDQVGKVGNAWYFPARILGISVPDFLLLIKNEYNAHFIHWTEYNNENRIPFLLYDWQSYSDIHRFVLLLNKEARKKQFYI